MATVHMSVRPEDLSQVPKGSERIPEPGIMVIFGASGDLTKRKLLPALFHLEQVGLLPKEFSIVGVARRPLGDEFAADMREGIVEFGEVEAGDPKLDNFAMRISYFPLKFDDPSDYAGLKTELDRLDKEKNTGGNRLFYLATAPEFFAGIIENLGAQGMAEPEHGRVGVVIEKPFGHDPESARELNHQVNAVFHEDQVFRIDHYLGKETVQNILVFRFANGLFENVWNRNYIDHIETTAAAATGVEGRGARCDAEPRDGTAEFCGDGAARVVRALGREGGEDQGVSRDPADPFCRHRARTVRAGDRGWQAGGGVSPGRPRSSAFADGDLRGGAGGDRELALGGRAHLPARGQAHGEARDRDYDPVQAAAAAAVQGRQGQLHGGHQVEPYLDAHPAGRGDRAALRGEGAGAVDVHQPGGHELQLFGGVRCVFGERVRAVAAGRDARRCNAVRASRWSGSHVGADDADPAVLGEESDQGLSQLRGRNVGAVDGRCVDGVGWSQVEKALSVVTRC